MNEPAVHDIARYTTQSGVTLDLKLAYRTFGELSAARDNVIIVPTFYGGRDVDTAYMHAPGRAIDPSRYFVIVPNMFGNGRSSSPSNTPPPYGCSGFPVMSLYDNVVCQHRLLTEVFDVRRVRLVAGYSMGGMQAYQWAASFPDEVERIAVVCGAARCAWHNYVFLEGVKAALTADPAWRDGRFERKPERGLRAMGRVYAGWAMSQAFYRDELWRQIGFSSLEDYLVGGWEGNFLRRHAEDLLAQIHTWQHFSIADDPAYGGDFEAALRAIRAEVLLMPGRTDLYFRVEDNADELPRLARGRLAPIESDWGHRAGNPVHRGADWAFIREQIRALLER